MKRSFRNNGLSIVLFVVFFSLLLGQSITGFWYSNDQQKEHGQPTTTYSEYLLSSHFLTTNPCARNDPLQLSCRGGGGPCHRTNAPVQMGVVCFRAIFDVGSGDDLFERTNDLNRSVVKSVNATGLAYLTHTVLRENVAMRVAVGNVLTTEQHLAEVFSLIKQELQSEKKLSTFSGTSKR